MNSKPLRYKISKWDQLSKVLSNNSKKLHITVAHLLDRRLTGQRISVIHDDFGCLFSCVLQAKGDIVNELNDNIVIEFTPTQILSELEKYGFFVTYDPEKEVSSSQLNYLITLRGLGYDKIRILNTYTYFHGEQVFKWYIVAFKIKENADWINNAYAASEKEFLTALENGSAINISNISQTNNYTWSWLYGYVANIDDILEDNAE